MARRKVLTTVYARPDQLAELNAIARRLDVPAAALIREGIDAMIRRFRDVDALEWDQAVRLGVGRPQSEVA